MIACLEIEDDIIWLHEMNALAAGKLMKYKSDVSKTYSTELTSVYTFTYFFPT